MERGKVTRKDMDVALDYWFHWLQPLEPGQHGHWTGLTTGDVTRAKRIPVMADLNLIRGESDDDSRNGDDYLNYDDGDSVAVQGTLILMKGEDDVGGDLSGQRWRKGVRLPLTEMLNSNDLGSSD